MQDKMATRNRALNAAYSASFALWFPLFRALTRVLSREALFALARQTIGRFFALRPKYLAAIRENFAQILGEPPGSRRVAAAAREMIDQHSYHWIDFFYFAQRPFAQAQALISEIEGYEKIVAAERAGKGVLLATAHLGNWYLGGMLLGGLDHPIHVVLKPDRFPIVERFRREMHDRWGVREIAVGDTFLSGVAVVQALSRGQILGIQCDRDFNNTGIAVEFFGRPAYFPRGPFAAAMVSGAAFLPSFILREDDRYRIVIEDALPIARGGDHETDLRANVEGFVEILERYVRAHPTQWYCFYPFWDDPSRRRGTDGAPKGPPRLFPRASAARTRR
jgi:Kdo2-lipid IVA lauroyltransferase/acyltransferase